MNFSNPIYDVIIFVKLKIYYHSPKNCSLKIYERFFYFFYIFSTPKVLCLGVWRGGQGMRGFWGLGNIGGNREIFHIFFRE